MKTADPSRKRTKIGCYLSTHIRFTSMADAAKQSAPEFLEDLVRDRESRLAKASKRRKAS